MTVVITAGSTATANKATTATIVRVSQEMVRNVRLHDRLLPVSGRSLFLGQSQWLRWKNMTKAPKSSRRMPMVTKRNRFRATRFS